ncbi:hypothetical protein AXI64_gp204 [Vibrio phage qdvp001]|uniref:hypothetical protein n=1 Tax=Vibrio phage qdvp001 TaxID=1003177 RepID=UPI000720BCDC|nr:hypothetical protein AXI64_gp204 [Vibrio phage qdvp001]ALM62196.1 hypothetical protein qdvp001_204 [Vibrio phage qdvp001]
MKDYKSLLSFQPILNQKVITIVEALQDGSLTKEQFHNRKAYAKRSGNLQSVLEYSIAFEIVNMLGED